MLEMNLYQGWKVLRHLLLIIDALYITLLKWFDYLIMTDKGVAGVNDEALTRIRVAVFSFPGCSSGNRRRQWG
jgi:hypothetical protein